MSLWTAKFFHCAVLCCSSDCRDNATDSQLLGEARAACAGRHSCTRPVPTLPLGEDCGGLTREMEVDYICGECVRVFIWKTSSLELILSIYSCPVSCYPWSSYVLAKDRVSTSLANNGWAAASQLPNMTENERKSLLLAKLSFHYNRTVHTEFELSNRKVRKSTY